MIDIDNILNLDRALTATINSWHSPLLDSIMIFLSDKWALIPVYVIVALYALSRRTYRFRRRNYFNSWTIFIIILLAAGATFFILDKTGHDIIKPYFHRLRPGFDLYTWDIIRTPDGKGGAYSFISNHAANIAGFAMITSLFFKRKWYTLLSFLLAIAVSYSRVYLGRHFLGDVICGFIYGIIVAWIVYEIAVALIEFLRRRMVIREIR